MGNIFSSPKAPKPVVIDTTPPEEANTGPAPVDPEAQKTAKERIEQEKLRRGRRSLRVDLTPTSSTGAGISIL